MGLICARGSFLARMLKRRKTADLSGSCFPTLHFVKDGHPCSCRWMRTADPSTPALCAPLRMTILCRYSLFAGFDHLLGVFDGRIGELGAAEHAGNFFSAVDFFEQADRRFGAAAVLFVFDQEGM